MLRHRLLLRKYKCSLVDDTKMYWNETIIQQSYDVKGAAALNAKQTAPFQSVRLRLISSWRMKDVMIPSNRRKEKSPILNYLNT